MKKEKLFLSLLFIVAIKVYSQDVEIDLHTPLELTGFEQFFKEDSSTFPLDKLNYHTNKSFSYDRSVYLHFLPNENKHRLMTKDHKLIVEIPNASIYDRIIWLQNCVVIKNRINIDTPPELYLINLNTEKLTIYKTKGRFYYIGHSDSLCYFYAAMDSSYIGDLFVPDENSIVSVNEKGLSLSNKKERDDENKKIYLYYNESFSIIFEKDITGKSYHNFHYFDSIWTYKEPIHYFNEQDVYHRNGEIYVNINSKVIYRFDKNNVTKVVDCDTLSIDQFMIEKNHLIYSINFHYQKPPLGILNLETKQTHYPVILQKK